MSMLLANRMASACPCCWDSQGQGCGSALCMPFSYVSETCPLMNFDGQLCRNIDKPVWVVPDYPPQCKQGWDANGNEPCIYGSGQIANAECECIGYWAQYCTEDVAGNRGRAWVVQFWCYDQNTGIAATSSVKVLDWECQCVGARYAYNLTISGCCCSCVLECSDCTGLPQFLTFDGTSNCFGDVTVVMDNGGSGNVWTGSDTSTNGDTMAVELDMDTCEFTISCNGSLASVVDLTGMITACDPLQIDIVPPVTFIAGCCTGPIPSPDWSGTITE